MGGYYLLAGLIFLVSMYVSNRLKSKFKKYSKIQLKNGMSGKEIAEKMLSDNRITDVKVLSVKGQLTDHYNPMNKTVNLSDSVYNGISVAATAVAAHECGHAVQHATAYQWLQMRSQMVPMVNMSNKMMSTIFLLGIFGASFLHIFSFYQLILLFVILQAIVTAFTLITLPVEFDASRRALVWLRSSGITSEQELNYANDALKWAASTYVVAALAAATYLLYYVSMLRD